MVYQYSYDGELITTYLRAVIPAKMLGVPASNLSTAAHNERGYKGFVWSYRPLLFKESPDVLEGEEWRDVVGYEGLYMVSSFGRVWKNGFTTNTNVRKRGHMVSSHKDENGYIRVDLTINKKTNNCQVHRLVASAFVDNPFQYNEVNHKDENPANNLATNLEWCSHKYNINYGGCRQRIGRANSRGVAMLTMNNERLTVFPSIRAAAIYIGKKPTSICAVCNGRAKSCGGYKWKHL